MPITHKILSNTFVQIFGKILTAVLSLVIIKAITSLESIPGLSGMPADYKLIYTYLSFFGIIADFGLFTIAVREMSQAKEEAQQRLIMGNIYGMRMFTILVTMAMASLFVFLIPLDNYSWQVKVGVAIASLMTIFTMLASTASAILQVHLKMMQPTIALIIGKIVMTAYILYIVWNFQTVSYAFYHLLIAGVFGTIVTFIMTVSYTKKLFSFSPQYHFGYWKKIFKEAFPYGLAIVLSTIYFKIDVLFLSFFREKNEIAIYGYPSSIIELLSVLPIYFMNSTLPTLSSAFEESKERVKALMSAAFNILFLITLPIVVGGILLARPLMAFIMSPEFLTGNVPGYYGSDLAFQLLLFPTLFAFLNTLFSFTLIASGNQTRLLKINFLGVLFNIITNLIFIPRYGFIAAGITTIFSELLIIFLTYRECRKKITFPLDFKTLFKIIIATTIMAAFLLLVQNTLPIVATVWAGMVVFFLSLFPLKILSGLSISKSDH